MAPDPKVLKAFSAMKELGISAQKVKPVLKSLLALYDKNWELIEEDNYRTLADAIFESADDEQSGDKRKDSLDFDGSQPPLKKLQLEQQQEDLVSSTMDNRNMILDLEEGEIPPTPIEPDLRVPSEWGLKDRETETRSHSLPPACSEKQKNLVSSNMAHRLTKSSSERASNGMHSIQVGDGPGSEHMPRVKRPKDLHGEDSAASRRKQPVNDETRLALTSSKLQLAIQGPLENSSPGSSSVKFLVPPPVNKEDRNEVSVRNSGTSSQRNRPFHQLDDITKGTEKVRIPLIDEKGAEQLPKFVYIPQSTIYQNAYIHFSLARIADDNCCSSCSADCLSSSFPCICSRDTGGVFAYTRQGLLNEQFLNTCISMNEQPGKHYHFYCSDCPLERAKNDNKHRRCKGHLVRKFIKECWRKCGCDMLCGNRVVQRGITCELQVFSAKDGKGWGLRTLQDLPKGSFVCEYVGEILTNMELYERNKEIRGNERHTYPVLLDADWGSEGVLKDDDALCLDATYFGNVARFINHRCFDANLLEIPVEVETPDHHYYHLAFFTKRKVEAFEELTWDYGIDFNDHSHPIKAFQCCCRSKFCRDTREKESNIAH